MGAGSVTAGAGDPFVPEVGAAGLALISLASLVVTVLRRQRMRRRLATRIAQRLAAITPDPRPSVTPAPTGAGRGGR